MADFVPTANPEQPDDPFLLKGRVALVIGAGDPLGRASAVALAESGADVAVASLRAGAQEVVRVHSVANEIWSLGRRNIALELNATVPDQIERAVDRVVNELGGVDILVNAADVVAAAPFEEWNLAQWHNLLVADLVAPSLVSRSVAQPMKSAGYGRIINIVSILAERGVANTAAYAAAHAGMLAVTRSLSQEWARDGITVNALQVGFYEGQTGFGDEPEAVQRLTRMLPAKALVRPEDVGAAVVAMAADSGFITGETIAVDGAATARV